MFTLRKGIASFLKQANGQLTNMEKTIANMHPDNVLKRGYTITRMNGKAVTRVKEASTGDRLETILADGAIISEVKTIKESSGS